MWHQKTRADFLVDGDRNTHLYHLSTVIRRHSNMVSMLQNEENEWINEDQSININDIRVSYPTMSSEEFMNLSL